MYWMEPIVIVLIVAMCWGIQVGITLGISTVLAVVSAGIGRLIRKRTVKLMPRLLLVTVLVFALLAALTLRPPVICPERYRDGFTEELRHSVRSVSRGLYAAHLPMVPAWVEVTAVEEYAAGDSGEQLVEFTVHYLWYGTQEMTYSTLDGYNITKPLTES